MAPSWDWLANNVDDVGVPSTPRLVCSRGIDDEDGDSYIFSRPPH